ncbi:MAG TPA: DUF4062 domain-containing protein [Gaiellaceae bacterium]|nr:DUF4062 domain-containing protein [Gaiellaceae bacterium]
MIRTPDQRVRVFVSSTLEELASEREAARAAVESLRLTPVMFELGARPHPPREVYRSYLEQSDVFVGICGDRYGWVAPDADISGLEDELLLGEKLPRLLYVRRPAPDRDPRLAAMVSRIEGDSQVSYRAFSDAGELRGLIENDLALLLSERFAKAAGPEFATGLPAAVDRFVGRTDDLERLQRALAEAETRLVTVTGPGGVGRPAWRSRRHAAWLRGTRTASASSRSLPSPTPAWSPPRSAKGSASRTAAARRCGRPWPPSGARSSCSSSTTSSTSPLRPPTSPSCSRERRGSRSSRRAEPSSG